jgi:hypothetical protein
MYVYEVRQSIKSTDGAKLRCANHLSLAIFDALLTLYIPISLQHNQPEVPQCRQPMSLHISLLHFALYHLPEALKVLIPDYSHIIPFLTRRCDDTSEDFASEMDGGIGREDGLDGGTVLSVEMSLLYRGRRITREIKKTHAFDGLFACTFFASEVRIFRSVLCYIVETP